MLKGLLHTFPLAESHVLMHFSTQQLFRHLRVRINSGCDFRLSWNSFSVSRTRTICTVSLIACKTFLLSQSFLLISSSPTRLLERSMLRELPQIPALLEEARIRQVSKVPDVLVLPRPLAKRRVSSEDRHRTVLQVHRRSSDPPVATLHTPANKNSRPATLPAQSTA